MYCVQRSNNQRILRSSGLANARSALYFYSFGRATDTFRIPPPLNVSTRVGASTFPVSPTQSVDAPTLNVDVDVLSGGVDILSGGPLKTSTSPLPVSTSTLEVRASTLKVMVAEMKAVARPKLKKYSVGLRVLGLHDNLHLLLPTAATSRTSDKEPTKQTNRTIGQGDGRRKVLAQVLGAGHESASQSGAIPIH